MGITGPKFVSACGQHVCCLVSPSPLGQPGCFAYKAGLEEGKLSGVWVSAGQDLHKQYTWERHRRASSFMGGWGKISGAGVLEDTSSACSGATLYKVKQVKPDNCQVINSTGVDDGEEPGLWCHVQRGGSQFMQPSCLKYPVPWAITDPHLFLNFVLLSGIKLTFIIHILCRKWDLINRVELYEG